MTKIPMKDLVNAKGVVIFHSVKAYGSTLFCDVRVNLPCWTTPINCNLQCLTANMNFTLQTIPANNTLYGMSNFSKSDIDRLHVFQKICSDLYGNWQCFPANNAF